MSESPSRKWGALTITLAVLTASIIVLTPAVAAAATDTLGPGQTLTAGQELVSSDGHYDLTMQSDGDLVLSIANGRTLWDSNTAGNPGAYTLMQTNGSLAVFDSSNEALWSTDTSGAGCGSLTLQTDGNLVIYTPSGTPAWYTGTANGTLEPGDQLTEGEMLVSSGSEQYKLLMQGDGNLVLYDAAGTALWNTGTEGNPGAYAIYQSDGNLVVYSNSGTALWNTVTAGDPSGYVVVQSDGNLVMYAGSTVIWQSGTEQNTTRQAAGRSDAASSAPAELAMARSATAPAGNCGVPTTTTAPTVVTVPTVVYVPAPTAPHHVKVKLKMSWTWDHKHTRLYSVTATGLPRRGSISVTCRGSGCPRKAQVASAHVKRLLKSLTGARYKAGDRLFITISSPGDVAERIELWIRDGKKPRFKLL